MFNSKKPILGMVLIISSALFLTSCIRDEAENTEADITSFDVQGVNLIGKPEIGNDKITLYVNGWDDISHLAPTFTVTEGATAEPASGTVRDFTTPQTYTITSQDGQWKKTYVVAFSSNDIATEYHFENMKWYEYEDKWNPKAKYYHIFYDNATDGLEMDWGSGNAGAMLTLRGKPAEDYPTSQADDGYKGKCAKLQTISTGFLGAMMHMPIAAGNLFVGTFDTKNLIDALHSTKFGRPFHKVPEVLEGYYKYKAGKDYTDKSNKVVAGKKDDFSIYAVLFDTTISGDYLFGDNSLTSDGIVLKAELSDRKETDEWTKFSIPFESVNGRTVDKEKLAAGKYKITIVMSSSRDGASFQGAVGSTLYVDEMKLFSE